ncbi:hypothetical protein B0H12DRAFT_1163996 [Mycena haematopus]|nr:hypothetical protein B0H12DRAFT_1163996 [Mycena haematopus]
MSWLLGIGQSSLHINAAMCRSPSQSVDCLVRHRSKSLLWFGRDESIRWGPNATRKLSRAMWVRMPYSLNLYGQLCISFRFRILLLP